MKVTLNGTPLTLPQVLFFFTLAIFAGIGATATYYVNFDTKWSGWYDNAQNYYVVKPFQRDTWEVLQTAQHETGHYLFNKLDEHDQNLWKWISNSSKPDQFVSEYATTSYGEDFAETYEQSIVCHYNPIMRPGLEAKRGFMDVIMHNQPVQNKLYEIN
jgi:hypothetical protein